VASAELETERSNPIRLLTVEQLESRS